MRAELLADIALESCEAGDEQFAASGLLLFARRADPPCTELVRGAERTARAGFEVYL